jgi:hypothetical protein
LKKTLLGIAALVAAVLGCGWWQAHTHADVWLRVLDHAGRTTKLLWSDVTEGRLALRDAAGRVVAEATLERPQGLPRWTGPGAEAAHCDPKLGRDAWQRCWPKQAAWMARWVPRAHDARVTVGACTVDPVAVVRRDDSDWWLWWVPLPHVGGTPMAHYTLELHIDSARCTAERPPY